MTVLFSESAEGLVHSLDLLHEYCERWQLTVNLKKTKVIVFNLGGRLLKDNIFKYDNT